MPVTIVDKILEFFLGSRHEREMKRLGPRVASINAFEAALTALSLIAEYGNKIKEGVAQLFVNTANSQVFERFYAGMITISRDAQQAVTSVRMSVDMLDPRILIGIFLGAVLPSCSAP
jgi:Na+/H+-translocating membrane pyrophosphatase